MYLTMVMITGRYGALELGIMPDKGIGRALIQLQFITSMIQMTYVMMLGEDAHR